MIKEIRAVIATTAVAERLRSVEMHNDRVKDDQYGVPVNSRRVKIATTRAERLTELQWIGLDGVMREEFGDRYLTSQVVSKGPVTFYLLFFTH